MCLCSIECDTTCSIECSIEFLWNVTRTCSIECDTNMIREWKGCDGSRADEAGIPQGLRAGKADVSAQVLFVVLLSYHSNPVCVCVIVCVCVCVRACVCVCAGGIQRLRQKTLQQGRGVRSRALTTTSSLLPPSCWVTARVLSLSLSFTPRLLSLPFGRPVLGRACTRVRSCAGAREDANSARRHAHLHACTHTNQRTRTHARTHAARTHARTAQATVHTQTTAIPPPNHDRPTHPRARTRAAGGAGGDADPAARRLARRGGGGPLQRAPGPGD